jgi:DNA-directed RNA polymerase subunit A"
MEIYLNKEYDNENDAKVLAEKIKEVRLKEIASEISLDFSAKQVEIRIDNKGLKQTHTSIKKVVETLNEKGFDAKEKADSIVINASELSFKDIYKLKEKLKETIISGVKGVSQILVVKKEKNYIVVTLGTNLKEVLKMKEVDTHKTISNDLHEVCEVFGVEAGRQLIINEIAFTLNNQGLDIDERHLKLVADAMTNAGSVKGVTRMGIIAQKASILARATFETPDKQFVNASIKGDSDKLTSVVENIILNQPVPLGTGLPGLMVEVVGPLIKKDSEKKKASSKVVEETNK